MNASKHEVPRESGAWRSFLQWEGFSNKASFCDTISKPESLFFSFLLFAEASLSLLLVSHIGVLLRWGEA
jgi:hypothetical protein